MPDRPLILFPSPERADREHKPPVFTKTSIPSYGRQFTRLQPSFNVLNSAFTQKSLKVQQSPVGINPEFALVFEIIGTVDNFYTAVKNTDGLEWIFDKEAENIEPDDDFYQIDTKTGNRIDDTLNGKLYCVMSNQQAMTQLLSLWHRHQNGETDVFKRGFTGIRDLFTHIKDIRKWDAQDRIAETLAVEYWRENLELGGDSPVPFEIELFYRSDVSKRNTASETIRREVHTLNGRIIQECVISEVFYHGMLVELPRTAIEDLVNRYEEIELSQVDDIMFFRPTCQSVFTSETDFEAYNEIVDETALPTGDAVVAVFVATIFMLLYIWFRFKDIRFASSAIIALIHDVLVVLALYAVARISVGSAFIACMLTVIGYSVNDTIVIFDRIRENKKVLRDETPESLQTLANESITQTLSRSISTSFTTVVMVLMLLILGVTSIREFALPLLVGIVCGTYSSICIATELWYVMKVHIKGKKKAN